MESFLHGSARMMPCLRAELQASQESSRSLAARYGLNSKRSPEDIPTPSGGDPGEC